MKREWFGVLWSIYLCLLLLWIRYRYSDLLTGFSWTLAYLNLWFVNLCYVPFYLWTFDMIHLKWTFAMNLWFELWLWTLPFVNLWPEPLLCTLDYDTLIWLRLCYLICLWPFSIIPEHFPSHEGNMAVALMHQCHDSSVVEWCSTPSLCLICIWFG